MRRPPNLRRPLDERSSRGRSPRDRSRAPAAPGFITGFWHGLILPVTFVVSLVNDEVGGYEASNGGHLYDLGFVLGAGGLALPEIFARRR